VTFSHPDLIHCSAGKEIHMSAHSEGRAFWMFLMIATVFFAVVVVVAVYVEQRLSSIEGRLSQVPPRSYTAPDLDAYAATDFSADDMIVNKSLYVPSYSHIYHNGGSPYLLETTLSVRNVDRDQSIYLTSVAYYDTDGSLTRTFVDQPIELKPLRTIDFLIEVSDTTGGSGANFMVDWSATEPVSKPLVESVMVGTSGTQAICFSRTGIEVEAMQR
jgi:hypothetical protein